MLKYISLPLVLLLAYLFFWPVKAKPQSWNAPANQGYVGAFAPNTDLANLERLEIGGSGPEDVVARKIDGTLYIFAALRDGTIRKINAATKSHEIFTRTDGAPLGMEFDAEGHLIVADAVKGLVSIAPDGTASLLTNKVDGDYILFADDLDIASDGTIYFSDGSTKYAAKDHPDLMHSSTMEVIEHGRTGRLLAYDPETKTTRIVAEGFTFANGVAMGPDDQSVLVNDTGEYRIMQVWLEGSHKGKKTVVIENLPGFPDNINRGPDGTYIFGLVSQRVPILDIMADKPFLRKVTFRIPSALQPKAKYYGIVIQMDSNGKVLRTWQDPAAAYPATTGAIAPGDGYMYVTSLKADHLARRPFP